MNEILNLMRDERNCGECERQCREENENSAYDVIGHYVT